MPEVVHTVRRCLEQCTDISLRMITPCRGGVSPVGVRNPHAELKPLAARDNRLGVKQSAPIKALKARCSSLLPMSV